MLPYARLNNIAGWVVFLFATAVYTLTVEPTASFWDCGEFIACSYKLQVPHPPGAPFYLLVGRFFSLFAPSLEKVALAVNMVSVLSSSLTILFLFWTISFLAKKIVAPGREPASYSEIISILGASLVGSLAYSFTDSFWFSSAEAEVYAMSSFFTAFVFWAILKWESVAHKPQSDRWLILIAYMIGLSIGVHLLNLVAIPALAFVVYFKKYRSTNMGMLITFIVSMVILGIIQVGVIQTLPTLAGSVEVFFVNDLGLPFYIGEIMVWSLVFLALVLGNFWVASKMQGTQLDLFGLKISRRVLHLSMLGLSFVFIGYLTYGMVRLRSFYDPPIDENDPEIPTKFVSYLKREQYGERPIFYGPVISSQPKDHKKANPNYIKSDDKYEVVSHGYDPVYPSSHKKFFPRIYSQQGRHRSWYKRWGVDIPNNENKKSLANYDHPSLGENLAYFFRYQIGHMYLRYFMWNFSGRASDVQHADYLTIFTNTDKLPELIKENKARNNYYMLPLLLGLVGLVYHVMRNDKDSFIVGLLFFFTGLAIIVYLNQPPVEPRERDYTFVGSFYAFSIWIGLGVLAVIEGIRKYLLKNPTAAAGLGAAVCLVVPGILAAENWDDHDRSNRWHSVDSAKNLLLSCKEDAILFTGGDNDTFPLWYVQEVEGFRTDVRVCNLSLLGTDWYINQMTRQAYESEPLPITLDRREYIQGKNDVLFIKEQENLKSGIKLKRYFEVFKESPKQLQDPRTGYKILPTKKVILPIDKERVRQMDMIPEEKEKYIQDQLVIKLDRRRILKPTLIMLDILAHNNWERPIYYSSTLGPSNKLGLESHMQLEGLAMRLLPVKVPGARNGFVNTDIMYENMVEKMHWRELDNPEVYYNEDYKRFPQNARNNFARLAEQFLVEGDTAMAEKTINFCLEKMPDKAVPYDFHNSPFVSFLLSMDQEEKAMDIADKLSRRAVEYINYAGTDHGWNKVTVSTREVDMRVYILQEILRAYRTNGYEEKAESLSQKALNAISSVRGKVRARKLQEYQQRISPRQRPGSGQQQQKQQELQRKLQEFRKKQDSAAQADSGKPSSQQPSARGQDQGQGRQGSNNPSQQPSP